MTSAKSDSVAAAWARQSPPARGCDHPDCSEAGLHRAPRAPNVLDSYYWFCLDHIRSYNKAWNFFSGMSQEEIEAYQHADLTGHRPTWRFGVDQRLGATFSKATMKDRMNDPFGLFDNVATNGAVGSPPPRIPASERDALATMNLANDANQKDIKARFKELVKQLHPDINGGDKAAEERLKTVIEAYRLLLRKRSA